RAVRTGLSTPVPVGCGNSLSYHPAMGAFAARERQAPAGLPGYITLGRPMRSGGPNFLGAAYAPLVVPGDPNGDSFQVKDVALPKCGDATRLDARGRLLATLDPFSGTAGTPADPARSLTSCPERAAGRPRSTPAPGATAGAPGCRSRSPAPASPAAP